MAKKKDTTNYEKCLEESFARWEDIYHNGCSDPSWPDGVNLNLVRNHIHNYKRRLEENMPLGGYPAVYYRPDPPKVDPDYIAQADAIRLDAAHSLELYERDANYQFLRQQYDHVDPKLRKKICLENVLGYFSSLKSAIARDDLVAMRRHRRSESYLSSFEHCAERLRGMQPAAAVMAPPPQRVFQAPPPVSPGKMVQLTLF